MAQINKNVYFKADRLVLLPRLPSIIDQDQIDLIFSHKRYCGSERASIQKIHEIHEDDFGDQNERLVIIEYSHPEGKTLNYYIIHMFRIRLVKMCLK